MTPLAPNQVTLEKLAAGAAGELFELEMTRVVRNIADLNTSAIAARKITIEVEIKPEDSREKAAITVRCNSKLAPTRPATSLIFIGKVGNTPVAVEHNPRQQDLFPNGAPEGSDKVVPLFGDRKGVEV